MNVPLRQVDIVVVGFSHDGDLCFQTVVRKGQLFGKFAGFLRHKVEHELFRLAHLQNAFSLVDLEAVWDRQRPFCGLLTDVADHDRLFSFVFDGDQAVVELVWEVEHGATPPSPDGHNEFFALSHDHQIVGVVAFGFGAERDHVADVHPWGNLG